MSGFAQIQTSVADGGLSALLIYSEARRAGLADFLEKRKPEFGGQ
jgi:hypothetical protein|tara:strand:- start:8648 stop:8782 length:135 start_codon:yes stop_codon:yes gene_type:complete